MAKASLEAGVRYLAMQLDQGNTRKRHLCRADQDALAQPCADLQQVAPTTARTAQTQCDYR
jgi:enoyl-[acyl-carrier-protein] reductase (NADH)